MPLPVIANTYRCAFEWQHDDFTGLAATNVMHFRKSSTTPAALATLLAASVTAAMWHEQDTHAHVRFVNITPLDGSSVTLPYATGGAAKWSGAQTTHDPVPQVSNIIKLDTAKRGRSYRGRVYLPWVVTPAINGGALSAGDAATVTTAWVAFLAALNASTCDMVVASYTLATAEPVIALACELDTATIRRRNSRNSLTP